MSTRAIASALVICSSGLAFAFTVLPKKDLRRRLDPVRLAAEGHGVQVVLEDLLLVELVVDRQARTASLILR